MKKGIMLFFTMMFVIVVLTISFICTDGLFYVLIGYLAGNSIFNISDKFSTWITSDN